MINFIFILILLILIFYHLQIYKLAGSNLSDETIRNTLQEKLLPYGSISYLEMATAAYQKGRRRLATMILDIVQNAVDQVRFLVV